MAHLGADGAVPVQPNVPADLAAPDPNEVITRELLQTLVERGGSGMGHSVEIFCGYSQESIDLWLNRMEQHLAIKRGTRRKKDSHCYDLYMRTL